MALEIERKFRVTNDSWRTNVVEVRHIRQAYLAINDKVSVRVRIVGRFAATMTIKTVAPGITRHEYEYAIPVKDAQELMDRRVGAIIEKTRHVVPYAGLTWEIDVFSGAHAGLVVAEVELGRSDQLVIRPPWLGDEVSHDRRFSNAELALRTPEVAT